MSELDEFGKVFIKETRDLSINNMNKKLYGQIINEEGKELHNKFDGFTDEQKNVIKNIVSKTVDTVIDNFLFMIEQHDEIALLYNDVNLNEASDGLSGELYTEDGWIQKYSSLFSD